MKSVIILLTVICAINALIIKPSQETSRNKQWWEKTIFYQIYPRSFKDSDGNGVGDLKGIKENLQHLKDAGIGATWLSPIFRSPMRDFGYDISNFLDVDPTFGTIEELDELIAEAHKLDIKVILDFVPNHSSDQHQWFKDSLNKDSEYADYYVWREAKGVTEEGFPIPPNNWVTKVTKFFCN